MEMPLKNGFLKLLITTFVVQMNLPVLMKDLEIDRPSRIAENGYSIGVLNNFKK